MRSGSTWIPSVCGAYRQHRQRHVGQQRYRKPGERDRTEQNHRYGGCDGGDGAGDGEGGKGHYASVKVLGSMEVLRSVLPAPFLGALRWHHDSNRRIMSQRQVTLYEHRVADGDRYLVTR